jgi:competence protein ComEA
VSAPAPDDSLPALLDLNSASMVQLNRLPGIRPAHAALIVRVRERNGPFRSVDELRALPGISAKRLAQLREWVTVIPPRDTVKSQLDSPSAEPKLQ